MKLCHSLLAAVQLISAGLYASDTRAQASFQGLGDLPGSAFQSGANGVSGDGTVIVGTGVNSLENIEPFRWAGSMAGLGFLPGGTEGAGNDISADGSVVVGFSENSSGETEAFRWSNGGGMVGLGDLPGGVVLSIARGVSADGSTVVGEGRTALGNEAVRWSGGGPQALGDLPGGSAISVARAASADGSVVVGAANIDGGGTYGEAFRWTAPTGMVGLGMLPGYSLSVAFDVSDDGLTVVGQAVGGAGSEAFRWTAGGGMEPLGDLPGGPVASRALAVSADGSAIVGAGVGDGNRTDAFVWTEQEGMRSLTEILGNAGIDVSGWTLVALGVSDDGSVIVGQGTNPTGQQEAWRAVLPGACEEPLALRSWIDPAGGAFGDPNNWSTSAVPSGSDRALFGLSAGADYTVSFAAGHTNDQVLLRGGNHVRFALGGQTYSVTGDADCGPSLDLGDGFQSPRLEVENGALVASNGARVSGTGDTELTIRAGADMTIQGGLSLGNESERDGTVRVESAGLLEVGGPTEVGLAGSGDIRVEAGGHVTIQGPVRLAVEQEGDGDIRVQGSQASLTVAGDVTAGVGGIGLVLASDAASLTAEGLVLGRLEGALGTLLIRTNAHVTLRDLDVGVDGEAGVDVDGVGFLDVTRGVSIPRGSGEGSVDIQGAGGMRAGTLRLNPGGRLTVRGLVSVTQQFIGPLSYVNLAGGCLSIRGGPCLTTLGGAGGTLEADSVWIAPGAALDSATVQLGATGLLGGSGSLALDLTNAGTINPGDSAGVAGTFTIGGAYTQAPSGVLEIELGGTAAGAYDHLAVAGAATLDGVLRFSHIAGFTPGPGDMFDVLTAGSVTGAFAVVEGPPGCTYSLAYGPTTVTATVLTVDAEPPAGAAALMLLPPAPNPATGPIALRYQLAAPAHVRLAVYDALGREVAVLLDGQSPSGMHDATLESNSLSAGRYVARLSSGNDVATRSFTIAR